jgi:hypothetical protein
MYTRHGTVLWKILIIQPTNVINFFIVIIIIIITIIMIIVIVSIISL